MEAKGILRGLLQKYVWATSFGAAPALQRRAEFRKCLLTKGYRKQHTTVVPTCASKQDQEEACPNRAAVNDILVRRSTSVSSCSHVPPVPHGGPYK